VSGAVRPMLLVGAALTSALSTVLAISLAGVAPTMAAPPRRRAAPPRTFRFAVKPYIWTMTLDGNRLGRLPGLPTRCTVGPGQHVLLFRHPAVYPHRVVIHAHTPGATIRHQLRYRPATLLVDALPTGARAHVLFRSPPRLAGRPPFPTGLPYAISLRSGALNARVAIFATGYRYETRTIRLWPGRLTHLRVRLRKLRRKLRRKRQSR
jgi:hypothetical protein